MTKTYYLYIPHESWLGLKKSGVIYPPEIKLHTAPLEDKPMYDKKAVELKLIFREKELESAPVMSYQNIGEIRLKDVQEARLFSLDLRAKKLK
ncbi:MAG: hypothetical protein QMD65_02095 [Patescibacteria group bacterium]|nr:hypothetical protein [Patescibacteria group bacterium]